MSYSSLLNTSCYLQTRTSSQNSIREWIYSYTTAPSSTSCRMDPITASERIDRTGLYDDVKYTGFFEYSSRIDRDGRLVYNDEVYRIKEVVIDSESHHKEALLVLLT